MEINELLAKNIKLYRNRLGYTQERLAEECSFIQEDALVNRSFISDIENCRRNIALDKVGTLAKALKVEPYQLFLSRDIGERY